MTSERLERRIAKLESLIMNESLSEIVRNEMNINEYKDLCSTITWDIANEIKKSYPNLTVEVIKDDFYSRIKLGSLLLNIDYPTLDFDKIYADGSTTIYLTKEVSTSIEKPRLDRGVVRMPSMTRTRTKTSNVNYNGNISDSSALVRYLSKVKMFRDEVSRVEESINKRTEKLESLIMNESLSEIVSDDMIEKLGGMNKSNQLDNDTFRWAASVNLLSNLIDIMLEDENANADSKEIARLYKALNKAGYATGADLIRDIVAALDRKMEDFKAAKKNLNEIMRSAKKFDKMNK